MSSLLMPVGATQYGVPEYFAGHESDWKATPGLMATTVPVSALAVVDSVHSAARIPGCTGLEPLMTSRTKVESSSQPVEYSRKKAARCAARAAVLEKVEEYVQLR